MRAESARLALGLGGVLVGIVVGLAALRGGTSPLTGAGSIGQVAAVTVLGTGGLAAACSLTVLAPPSYAWMRSLPRWRRAADVLGLSLVLGLLSLFLVDSLFAVFQQAFVGLALDPVAGTFWVALADGVSAYVVASAAAELTSRSLATVLAGFLTAGVLSAAAVSPDPSWWERYFSDLGEGRDLASFTFSLTLLLTGVALVTVAEFCADDLSRWARVAGEPARTVRIVRAAPMAIGVLVSLVALVSRTVSVFWHDVVAQALVVVFALSLLAADVVLFSVVGYLNITAFEMGAAGIVYGWLLLFLRTVAAAADGAREHTGGDGPGDPDGRSGQPAAVTHAA